MRVNEAIAPICRTVAGFSEGKNEESSEFSELSNVVPHSGFMSNRFMEDLDLVYQLKPLLKIARWVENNQKVIR